MDFVVRNLTILFALHENLKVTSSKIIIEVNLSINFISPIDNGLRGLQILFPI